MRRLASFGLAALAAPGNLPALAAMVDLEVVILTTDECRRYLEAQPIHRRLAAGVAIRFLPIDDLVQGRSHYAVPLTQAYWRGIAEAGDDMVNIHFIFMNADFVLADGSLASLAKRIVAGQRVVLTSNMRCNLEGIEPDLLRMLDPETGILSISPRPMVAMALRHEHALEIAKTVNSPLSHSAAVNQLFWRADADTVISHHYLCFMLSLRPERVVEEIRGFCDYAFVPELCPESEPVALDDSDEYCMIELQAELQEFTLLRIGRTTMEETASVLSAWTTRAQRKAALNHQIIFHAADLSPAARRMADEVRGYMRKLDAKLAPAAQPHMDHPYWTGAVRALSPEQPVRLAEPAGTGRHPPGDPFHAAPRLAPWHPEWLDYRVLAARLDEHKPGTPLLYLSGRRRVLADTLAREGCADAVLLPLGSAIAAGPGLAALVGEKHGSIFVELDRDTASLAGIVAGRLLPLLALGGQLVFFLHDPKFWTSALALAYDMRHMLPHASPIMLHRHDLRLAGGERRRRLLVAYRLLASLAQRGGGAGRFCAAAALLPLAALSFLDNRRGAAVQDRGGAPRDCSSFVLTVWNETIE